MSTEITEDQILAKLAELFKNSDNAGDTTSGTQYKIQITFDDGAKPESIQRMESLLDKAGISYTKEQC